MKRTWIGLAVVVVVALVAGGISALSGPEPSAVMPRDLALLPAEQTALPALDTGPLAIAVYKSPTCGCCEKWVDHLREHGFTVETRDTDSMDDVKANLGVPNRLESCHTGVAGGYVIEGHVPADVVKRLLSERPKVAGIAVPGMPLGSPGMEAPRSQRYDVLTFGRDGKTSIYSSH